MSMRSDVVHGYGFVVDEMGGKAVLKFIKNHAKTVKDIYIDGQRLIDELNKIDIDNIPLDEDEPLGDLDIYEGYENLKEILSDISDHYETNCGDIIAAIMSEKSHIQFQYEPAQPDECYGEPSILLQAVMPWVYSYRERSITEEELNDILTDYAEELGVDVDTIGMQDIEYFG